MSYFNDNPIYRRNNTLPIKTILDEKEEFIFRVKKGDHRSLYRHIETAEYESHRNVMGNTTIAYRWYKNVPLNKSTDIKVTVIQAFVIKKDKNGKQISTMVGSNSNFKK